MVIGPGASPAQPVEKGRLSPRRGYHWEAALLILCLFLFFFRLGSISLFDLDEALYVTCARQMALSGDYVTPRLNTRPLDRPDQTSAPFYEKPILVYWCAAGAMRLLGLTEGAARLPVACCALLTTGALYLAGSRWFGRRAGILAAVVYATAPLVLVNARQMTTDGLLTFWFTLAMFAFWKVAQPVAPRAASLGQRLFYPVLFWISCALAVLTKGAVGLLLPALVIGAFLTVRNIVVRVRWKSNRSPAIQAHMSAYRFKAWGPALRRLQILAGLAIVFVLASPWHFLVWRAGGHDADGRTFVQEYIVRQHIGRFRGTDKVHNAPLPTYLAYYLLGFFPWSFFSLAAFRRAAEDPSAARHLVSGTETSDAFRDSDGSVPGVKTSTVLDVSPYRFCLFWFWTIFFFFSLGAAKLPTYISPAYPAAALLTGRWLDRTLTRVDGRKAFQRGALGTVIFAALLALASWLAPRLVRSDSPIPPPVAQVILAISLTLLTGCAVAWFSFHQSEGNKNARLAGVVVLIVTMLLVIGLLTTAGYAVAEGYILSPYQQIARDAREDAAKGMPVVFFHIIPRRPSMLYYASDYSPLEYREETLLPYLRTIWAQRGRLDFDLVTTRQVLDRTLQKQIAASTDFSLVLLRERKGWSLVRVHKLR